MSKIRESFEMRTGELATPPEPDEKPYEVFVQLNRGQPHMHAGTVDATDDKMALEYARKHYGRDQECVHMWVVAREAMLGTDYENDLIWPLTDQDYRLARGYAKDVRRKWEAVRAKVEVDEYQKEDIREMF